MFQNTIENPEAETITTAKSLVENQVKRILNKNKKITLAQFKLFLQMQVEVTKAKHYKDKKDFCMYCEQDVSHFGRHLFTWHPQEFDVQRILSFGINSKERREALAVLRNQGNFIRNRSSNIVLRPVKRLSPSNKAEVEDYLPCSHCFGFYKKRFLYRHTKRCSANHDLEKNKKRQTSQSDGHTTLLMNTFLKHDQLLKKELFPRMRADEINAIVKKDALICSYGYSYLKGRRSKGNLDLVRINMRRLAKLLKFAREKDKSVKELIDILHPTRFRLIIDGVNEQAKYNPETDIYESPTLAMNFGTLLKKCCDLAYVYLLQKRDTDEKRKEVKIIKNLIESQWADEISAQAATNLKEKTWNKNELIPLTTDLKKLNDFLQSIAHDAYNTLTTDRENHAAYNTLKEALYCQIILLNRRRPAEVAQLKVNTYLSVNLDAHAENDEFQNSLTETEKILLNSYSRIVIRGKRGRGVPVLLSPNMRKHFDYLIQIRDNFVSDNEYVFHTTGKSFIDGTKTLQKYVKKCDVENPHSITATKLRKHLATVTQLLNFSNKDLEQLSNFMGHTLNTHCNFYRLPDNVYQTAKVSKLLLLMSQGGAENFKGKPLEDIDIDLEPLSTEENQFTKLLEDDLLVNQNSDNVDKTPNKDCSEQIKKTLKKPAKDLRISWSAEHKTLIASYFAKHIKTKQPPKRYEVEALMDQYPNMFEGKKWTSIKAVVYNIYSGKLKMPFVD